MDLLKDLAKLLVLIVLLVISILVGQNVEDRYPHSVEIKSKSEDKVDCIKSSSSSSSIKSIEHEVVQSMTKGLTK